MRSLLLGWQWAAYVLIRMLRTAIMEYRQTATECKDVRQWRNYAEGQITAHPKNLAIYEYGCPSCNRRLRHIFLEGYCPSCGEYLHPTAEDNQAYAALRDNNMLD